MEERHSADNFIIDERVSSRIAVAWPTGDQVVGGNNDNNNNNNILASTNEPQASINKLLEDSNRLELNHGINDSRTSSSSYPISANALLAPFSDLLNQVRGMIAQNLIEFLLVCVIISYLIYYFSLISKRPKLIGNSRSKFVEFIKHNLSETLDHRFSPLIYFWGTNPQTALFGYLLGGTSNDEMPREKFKRQYLYVSDAQYLTSNVDLSEHYYGRKGWSSSKEKYQLVPLQVDDFIEHQSVTPNSSSEQQQQQHQQQQQQQPMSQLNQNIRLALDDLLASQTGKLEEELNGNKLRTTNFLSSSGSSSSDSGVSAGHSSASSSTSSLADAVISNQRLHCRDDEEEEEEEDQNNNKSIDEKVKSNTSANRVRETNKCSCRYENSNEPRLDARDFVTTRAGDDQEPLAREQLEFGQCALDWHKDSHKNYHNNRLVALVSAGMTTGSDKKYVTDTVKTLDKLGYEVCVFIRRGVGGLKLSSAKFFSPAKWRDFEAAVLSVRQQRPEARMVAVGFSFGSIELCRYLSMCGSRSLIDAALLISCPFDPEAGGRNMQKRALNRKIDAYLANNLCKQLHGALFGDEQQDQIQPTERRAEEENLADKQHQKRPQVAIINRNGSIVHLDDLLKVKSLVDFEDNYNRVLQNYPTSEAYAADSRLQDHLGRIETPTLCLSSEDDFMAPLKLLPLEQIEANDNLCMVLMKRGGHMAFIDGLLWPKKPYFAQRIIGKYMDAVRKSLIASKMTTISMQQVNDKSAHQLIKIFDSEWKAEEMV